MSNLDVRLRTVFELAAEIDREPVLADSHAAAESGTAPDSAAMSEAQITRLTAILAEAAADLTFWSSDAEIDGLLTLGARMSVSSEAAMIEGAGRAMNERATANEELDDVETLLQLIAAVPVVEPTGDTIKNAVEAQRRSAADDLARSIDDITLRRCTPAECDAEEFFGLIKTADIDFAAAFAGISAATGYQYGMERQVVFQGRTVSTSPIDWTEFLEPLSDLLGL